MGIAAAARRIYDLQLERAHLRAVRSVVRRDGGATNATSEIERTLAGVEAELREVEIGVESAPMQRLAALLDLTDVDQELVWTAVAATADPRLLVHATALIGTEARRGMSLALYAIVAGLDGDRARALALRMSPAHPLLRFQLLEIADRQLIGTATGLRATPRLVSFLAGLPDLDPGLVGVGGPVATPAGAIFDAAQEAALDRVAEGLASSHPLVVVLEGSRGAGRRTAAANVAARHGRDVIALDVTRLPSTPAALADALVALRRECLLRGAIPLVAEVDDLADADPEGGGRARALGRFLDALSGTVLVTTSRHGLDLGLQRRVLRVDWPLADTESRRTLWRFHLGDGDAALSDAELGQIALRYRLGPGGIDRAAASARLLRQARGDRGPVQMTDLIAGVRNNIAESVGGLARRIEVKQTWDDLVLAHDLMDQVHALIGRIRHAHRVYEEWRFGSKQARGLGVPVLFSGPPGTGKTMLAGVIARELELELLQVDLSQVVSKWIGETEKQLAQVFDAAEAGHALLLFDEADALFAKRTEVKGANDRYANLEVNYLLQRVESFGGITILTTNLDASIDPALKRRLASHIVFWPPDEDERADLWRRILDTGAAPVAGEPDLHRLARNFPNMSGANIRNAVLAAAFLAAAEGKQITQDHLERAAKGEYRTMGHILR
jgi:hypothetical protein